MALFRRGAPWRHAARQVRVFKLYETWLMLPSATQSRLRRIMADLKRRHISLAVEGLGLTAGNCGAGVEGFSDPGSAATLASEIKRAGGNLKYIAFDEPFAFGSLYDGQNACHWPTDKVARELGHYVRSLRHRFPGLVAGDIEPLSGENPQELVNWMDTYKRVTGSRLGFFHLDLDYGNPNWPQDARRLEQAAHARGIPFGLIYNGNGSSTDLDWTRTAEQRFVEYEAQARYRPDQAIFQSWEDHPDHVLPETKQGTFTWLIDQYVRPRAHLKLAVSGDSATATLTDPRGSPLSGKTVVLSATPLDGKGQYAQYNASGTIPTGAVHAVVGLRVNMECSCMGAADLTLYKTSYTQDDGANRVPNPDLAQGLADWGTWGNANISIGPSDRGGPALNVTATPSQQLGLNSSEFAVTAGQGFHVSFGARVAPVPTIAGYFAVFFLDSNDAEVTRMTLPLEAPAILLGSATTNQNGVVTGSIAALHGATFRIQELFPGGTRLFPAYASSTVARP